MRSGKSFFIPTSGPDSGAIDLGLGWLIQHSAREKLVVFCQKSNAINISCSLSAKSFFNALIKQSSTTADNSEYRLATAKNLPSSFNGAMLLIHLSDGDLNKIDSVYGSFDALYIPWLESEGAQWKSRWGAIDIISQKPHPQQVIIENQQFKDIFAASCANNIHHTNDYNRMVDVIKSQCAKNILPSPANIIEYLLRKNWMIDDASEVAEMARKISQGQIVRKK